MFRKPVFIIGAPRSGTSLLQKIIREHPDFVSVPRESDMIWMKYTHPKNNEWKSEGLERDKLSAADCQAIRSAFIQLCVSASNWSRFSSLGIMENKLLAPVVRALYPAAKFGFKTVRSIAPKKKESASRLVDKSVHMGLWIDLVEKVFPDALFIHITRSPETCIPSIVSGWKDQQRFKTFKLPGNYEVKEIHSKFWKFHLPENWQEHLEYSIEEIATFQWRSIQNKILNHKTELNERYIQIKLEELSNNPARLLKRISEFIDLPYDLYFSSVAANLPVVNSRAISSSELTPSQPLEYSKKSALKQTANLLGYEISD